ncbi:carbohydrate ABC transporter permease [Jeotgalibacillus soli]|uniref:Sugar ABC transporter permease n=1 Tax=Jeotgalibacillus soli TaxID=889306 RepID=A0A0C2W049_9BACL|nr:carbohydrate ABC transporter permease [Jeotgalibacillus soli]KIL49543.1 sugar ABC transporter permease [Jeotgalibacillus soli]
MATNHQQIQLQLDEKKDKQRKIFKIVGLSVIYIVLTIWAILTFVPLIWMFISSIKDTTSITQVPPQLIPDQPTLDAYRRVFDVGGFARWFLNSVIVSTILTISNVVLASLAGYAFAKLKFPGRNTIFWILLGSMMIPGQITLIPLYILIVNTFQMADTYLALVIPTLVTTANIFLARQFMASLPSTLIDAARIDACSEPKIFWKVILPMAKPGLAVLGIFTFVANWNNFFWPFLVTSSNEMRTLQVGLTSFRYQYTADYGAMMAGAVLTAIPMFIVFLALQKYFLKGITIGAVKG